MSKIGINELIQIIKDSFEEQKGIKVLSLHFDKRKNTFYGIYVLSLEQSLSFKEEPLLDMTTDIDGHRIIMQELGQILLYSYNFGSINDYLILTELACLDDFEISNSIYYELLYLCEHNVPLQRFDVRLINWIELTDEVHKVRTKSFVEACDNYCIYDSLEYDRELEYKDDIYIQQQFKDVANQLKHKNHNKITEATIEKINQLYIQLQVDLYITDNKYYK